MLESPDMNSGHRAVKPIYLASNSPRRRELLSLTGLAYRPRPTQVDETPLPGEDGLSYVRRIADRKAVTAAQQIDTGGLIIAADTAVVDLHGNSRAGILGKPTSPEDAADMLRSLRGHTHQVYTALSILPAPEGAIRADLCVTDVPMRNYTDNDIDSYVASNDPLDKAGAYAIQHAGFHPVELLHGCFANVMGLPLCHLARNLVQLNILPPINVPQACQSALAYDCPVYPAILDGNVI